MSLVIGRGQERGRAVIGHCRSEFHASDPSLHAPPSSIHHIPTWLFQTQGRSRGLVVGPRPRIRSLFLGRWGRTLGWLLGWLLDQLLVMLLVGLLFMFLIQRLL